MQAREDNSSGNRPPQKKRENAQSSAAIKLLSVAKLQALVYVLFACLPGHSQQKKSDDLFTGTTFKDVDLNGMKLRVGNPVEVTSQLGWHIVGSKWDRWTFVHITPFLALFPNGDLLATYAMDPDTQQNPQFSSAYQISHDGGRTWGMRYTTLIQHIPMIFIPAPNNSLIALPSEIVGTGPQPDRNFTGPLLTFQRGGKRVLMEEDGFRVVDWPEPVDAASNPQPKDNWHRTIHFTGSYLRLGSELLATVYWHPHGAKFLQLSLASSKDGGHTWRLGAKPYDGRIVLLVDRHTASAAEMVAIFAKENKLATIVGEKTAGRLVSATSVKVGHGFRLALPTGAYYTWTGTVLEGSPIEPDVFAEFSWKERRNGEDGQLQKAIGLLNG